MASRLKAPQRREQLIAVATKQFGKFGYDATTTAAIADAAGVTEPILYRHFGSKQELFIAITRESRRAAIIGPLTRSRRRRPPDPHRGNRRWSGHAPSCTAPPAARPPGTRLPSARAMAWPFSRRKRQLPRPLPARPKHSVRWALHMLLAKTAACLNLAIEADLHPTA